MLQTDDDRLFEIEQDLMDLEEKMPKHLSNELLTIVEKVKDLQNG